MNYYWVNQGKTYKEEKSGAYLWAPVKNAQGNTFFHWENMLKLAVNDIVFNYRKGALVGYCVISSKSYFAPQPEEFTVDVEWEHEGHMADAVYYVFDDPLVLEEVYHKIEHVLPGKYSPINATKKEERLQIKANQGYLYQINSEVAKLLCEIAKVKSEVLFDDNGVENKLQEDYKTPDVTSRTGLVTSRVGQGEYRRRILKRWNYQCAVTKCSIKEILIASHIVPWKDSNNRERMDVDNGILLSPVYDALFDKHFISFNKAGKIILSKSLSHTELSKFGITGHESISNLSAGNHRYLEVHRKKLAKL
jgi:putative restriction endonuclease